MQPLALGERQALDHAGNGHGAPGTAVENHREKITAEYGQLGMVENENGIGRLDTLGADRRKRMIDSAVAKFRKELNAETAEERAKLLAEQRAARETLNLVRSAWASPEAILMLDTLGSQHRSACTRDLANAGATELENAMRRAVQTGNKDLAAACCVRLDSIGRDGRKGVRFSKTDVAEMVAGADFMKAQEAIGLADFAIAQSELAEREITGKPLSPGDKIRVGMMRQELESKIGKKLDADGHVVGPDGEPEGETFEQWLDRLYPGGDLPPGYEFVDTGGNEND